jgi:hypothetical protein
MWTSRSSVDPSVDGGLLAAGLLSVVILVILLAAAVRAYR